MLTLQLPPIGNPESNLMPGMAAPIPPEPAPASPPGPIETAWAWSGGFPNIPDSSVPGLVQSEVPGSWVYDFDPGTGSARATFSGEVQFTTGGAAGSVSSFNTRTGAVVLTAADVTGVGALVNPNVTLTGNPTAPTQTAGTSNTTIATTNFVGAAIAAQAAITSANFLPLTGGTVTGTTTFSVSATFTQGFNSQNEGLISYVGQNYGSPGLIIRDLTNVAGVLRLGGDASGTNGMALLQASNGNLAIGNSTGGMLPQVNINTQYFTPTSNNLYYCGVAAQAWTQVATYATFNPSSAQHKSHIRELPDNCLKFVSNLRPKRYRITNGPTEERDINHFGFIAEDVARVLGTGKDFGGHKGEGPEQMIAYNQLVAVLWRAVQELAGKVETLEMARA